MSLENKTLSLYHSKILPFFLSLAMLASPMATPVRSYADSMPDTTQSTAQVRQQQIDLSQYTRVAEQDGLELYVSKIRRDVKNWDHVYEKDFIKKWLDYSYFWDIIFKNNGQFGISLDKLEIKTLTGSKKNTQIIEKEQFQNWYLPGSLDSGKVFIPRGNILFAGDDAYTTGDTSNKKVQYTYYGKEETTGKNIEISFILKIN